MGKKLKFLGCCCFALLLLGSGKIWGQATYRYWAGQECHTMNYTHSLLCDTLQLDGTASMDFYRWGNGDPLTTHSWTSGTSSPCLGYTTEHESRIVWNSTLGTWTIQTQSRSRSCNTGTGNWNGWSGWSGWASGGTISGSLPNTASTTWVEINGSVATGGFSNGHSPHDHYNHPYDSLTLTLPSIVSSINFISPNWVHRFHEYTYTWNNGNIAVSLSNTSSSDYLPIGVMRSASTSSLLRFTSDPPQIQQDPSSQLTTTYLYLPNNIWFDKVWNGSYNSVDYRPWWDPVRDGVQNGQTLGFWHGYTGTTNITINNGVLLLGEDNSCPTQNFAITSSSLVIIDAYNTHYAPVGCVTMPLNVTYNPAGRQPTVGVSNLNMTNTNGDCHYFDFCSLFQPLFTGDGNLIIDPNVTNFNAGAYISTTRNGNVEINSKLITSYADFSYSSSGSGDFLIDISIPQQGDCEDCGYFRVLNGGNFTTTNTGSGNILIYNTDETGYVNVTGDYTHTSTSTSASIHSVNVDGKIHVEGTTSLTGANDAVSFTSNNSWIKFGTLPADTFGYSGLHTGTGVGSLNILASGICDDEPCLNMGNGGFVWFTGPVTTNIDTIGTVSIKSEDHYVKMDTGFYHRGVNGNMFIDGETGVDIIGAHNRTGIGVLIERSGTGRDSIVSGSGHVDVRRPFTFTQTGTGGTTAQGLNIWANGLCKQLDCIDNFVGGYVWLRNDVNTTNLSYGPAKIEATHHYVRIGENSASSGPDGGHLTHNGVFGDFRILAGSSNSFCSTICDSTNLLLTAITSADTARSFVWIGDDVNITMNGGASPAATEGNAIIRSWGDIIQMDDSVTFKDNNGANLWVDGSMGIRTLGPTALFNNGFDGTGGGNSPSVQSTYNTTGQQGFVTYLSLQGFIDFGMAPMASLDNSSIGGNTPFLYTAAAGENGLLIEGNTRVFFGDSVTINMAAMAPAATTNPGNAKVFSPNGWIMYADTVEFNGYDGHFITYANNNLPTLDMRSCLNFGLCDPRGGFVLYDSTITINYDGKGVTWIRSTNDDVVIGDMFNYNSTNDTDNGEIVIQAGQDIFGRNYDDHQAFYDSININQAGEKSILFEAKKTIHLEQSLFFNRNGAATGDITLKAGYPTFSDSSIDPDAGSTLVSAPASNQPAQMPSAELTALYWDNKGNCTPLNYWERFACTISRTIPPPPSTLGSENGGDIWLEGRVLFDLTTPANVIKTTLRAYNSLFIDSTLVYQQYAGAGGNVLMYAEIGNVEAAVTRQDRADFPTNGYIADDTVLFDIPNTDFDKEIRIQAGNRVWGEGALGNNINENAAPYDASTCWFKGCADNAEFFGNILFNKPLLMQNQGSGYTILSAARDIETQVMAPFIFTYGINHTNSGNLDITAGRHIETHALMQFNYPEPDNRANITLRAGRLNQNLLSADSLLCKATEAGTNLTYNTGSAIVAFDPEVGTGGVNGEKNNDFALGGKGNGSILLFDSLDFNYNGRGKILLVALNGNIESDPYLHRHPGFPANPGLGGLSGNLDDGYMPFVGLPYAVEPNVMQHDAQIIFKHGGAGVTQLKAIDIKLHDKIGYYVTLPASYSNGQFYITAFDSILTRNLEYVNPSDTGSVFITTAKYKRTSQDCSLYDCNPTDPCGLDNIPIQQGHIVLGYGADRNNADDAQNMNDSIVFNFSGNTNSTGANVIIRAGYEGFTANATKGTINGNLFSTAADKGKGYGGNITFDYMKLDMATGNHTTGGYLEISTPNGNIWGKDSINYRGMNGDILVDAGLGSLEDPDAIRWEYADTASCFAGGEKTLNTKVPETCNIPGEWRTGNIMMKGATLNFADGTGNATFRTREGYIDMYDAFTVDSMRGHLLVYAGTNNYKAATNQWGDVNERDFQYTPVRLSGSVFFGADDNIMLNYGYSNDEFSNADGYLYQGRGQYLFQSGSPFSSLSEFANPYYSTTYKPTIDAYRAIYNVNEDGYMWYRHSPWTRNYHRLYRGCVDSYANFCSGFTGLCKTVDNFARPLTFDFFRDDNQALIQSGGLGVVATNYIDMYTKFTYFGGTGSGMATVPGMTSLKGEPVAGYGLYMKSQFTGQMVEKRRATCEGCNATSYFPIGGTNITYPTHEWTYIGFHDDARIHTQNQKSLLEAPIVEFFGHAELDAYHDRSTRTKLTVKADSIIFHDSAVFLGKDVELIPFTIGDPRDKDMRYGVINDRGETVKYYAEYGRAITMNDRNTPVLEFGYQRCNEPLNSPHEAPNWRSENGLEPTPRVGGDIIVAFKYDFTLPIMNTVVVNHARISFNTFDTGSEYIEACVRTDLLRIRNKVEFFTDPNQPVNSRVGGFLMTSNEQLPSTDAAGMYAHHLHLEPGSELSLPLEDSLIVISTTTVGGYGEIHENIHVMANGIIAPGFASLMEGDCQTSYNQGKLTIHNLYMEKDAVMRISISDRNCQPNPADPSIRNFNCTQADTLYVQDSIFFVGKIPLYILPETEYLEPGCYLFLEYNDLNASVEYVNNLVLMTRKHGDYFFSLDKSERGRVYLCVTTSEDPPIQRYVNIHAIDGVKTDPVSDLYHYVLGHED